MINIVNVVIRYDDERRVTAVKLKFKTVGGESEALTKVMMAFAKTSLATSERELSVARDPKRSDIVNFRVSLANNNTARDISEFVDTLQTLIDETRVL